MVASSAIDELLTAQAGVRASVTKTFDNVTSPVFVTTIVNVAFAPDAITCVFGLFEIAIAGLLGAGG